MTSATARVLTAPRAAAITVLVLLSQGMSADLIGHFRISRAVAAVIVNLIVTGGFWTLAVMYPFIIPVQITLQTIVKVFGVTYAIGW